MVTYLLLGGIVFALVAIASALRRIAKRLDEWHLERMEARHAQEEETFVRENPGADLMPLWQRQSEERAAAGETDDDEP